MVVADPPKPETTHSEMAGDLRQSQLAALALKNVGMTTAVDTGDWSNVRAANHRVLPAQPRGPMLTWLRLLPADPPAGQAEPVDAARQAGAGTSLRQDRTHHLLARGCRLNAHSHEIIHSLRLPFWLASFQGVGRIVAGRTSPTRSSRCTPAAR